MNAAAVVSAAAGTVAGWLLGRRRAQGPPRRAEIGIHLLPDPALRWLLRANGAIGVWVSEIRPGEDGPSNERVVDAERLSISEIAAIDRRLERARDTEQGGVERMDGGTLVYRGSGGAAAAMLLPAGAGAGDLAMAEADVGRLVEALRRRPQLVALAQAHADDASDETVASIALRVAYHLERLTGAEAIVAAADPGGTRVVAISGRADRRLSDAYATPGSALARVVAGEAERLLSDAGFMGAALTDRRHRSAGVVVMGIPDGRETAGAAALWMPDGREFVGGVLAEILETLRNAGPRMARAARLEGLTRVSLTDPLTGLANRRGLEAAMGTQGEREGALVYADFDRFKQLNDALGHAAGDAALVHFARLVREQIRGGDTGARLGGEEFAVWLPGAPLQVGLRIAERLRHGLAEAGWAWQGGAWPLTASFGVAACPETSRSVENLSGQADAAMYAAKNGGRNQVAAAAPLRGG